MAEMETATKSSLLNYSTLVNILSFFPPPMPSLQEKAHNSASAETIKFITETEAAEYKNAAVKWNRRDLCLASPPPQSDAYQAEPLEAMSSSEL